MNERINVIKTKEAFDEAILYLKGSTILTVDTETSGLDVWGEDKLCGIGLSIPGDIGFYFPFRHKASEMSLFAVHLQDESNLSLELMPQIFEILQDAQVLIGHNLKFDLAVLYSDGFEISDHHTLIDTITGARLYFPDKFQPLNLEAVSDKILGTADAQWKSAFKKYLKDNKWTNQYDMAPPDVLGEYCIEDCIHTLQLRDHFEEFIKETGQERIWEQESALLHVLWRMEKEGLYFDMEYCVNRLEKLHLKLSQLELEIHALVGREFEIRSFKQTAEVMDELGIPSPRLTPGGKPKWGVAELMTVSHPIAAKILEFRGIEKMRSTYFEPLLKWADHRQHPSFKPWGAITGRMSCVSPSLMNLSNKSQNLAHEEENEEVAEAIKAMLGARTGQVVDMTSASGNMSGGGSYASLISYAKKYEDSDDTISVRRLYIPPPGYILYCIDFSQMEMRVFADYVQDDELHKLLESEDFDFHSHVAKSVWKVDEDSSLWKFYRNLAKAINFGLIYGIGNEKLASQIQKSLEEAVEYKKEYFARFPKALKFIHQVRDVVNSRGYITNRFGRRYTIEADKAYTGVNYLVQGCVNSGTQIITKEFGPLEIQTCPRNITVWDGREFVPAVVLPSGEKQLCKIWLNRNYYLESSPDHKFLTINTKGNTKWKAAKDLKAGVDRVLLQDPIPSWALPLNIPKALSGRVYNAHNYCMTSLEDDPISMGEWLGRVASDGSIGGPTSLLVAEHEKDIYEKLKLTTLKIGEIKEWTRVNPPTQPMPLHHIEIHSKALSDQLRSIGLKTKIPDFVWRNSDLLKAYLRGMFDGDGCVMGETVSLCMGLNKNRKLKKKWAAEIQNALLMFGIRSSVNCSADAIHLGIDRRDIYKFRDQIGFLSARKIEKLNKISVKTNHPIKSIEISKLYGRAQKVKKVEISEDLVPMYDVCNTPRGQFSANGIIVHNSSADIVKSRMVAIDEYLKTKQTKMVVQVHDELIFYVKEEEELEVVPKLKELLEERQIKTYLPTTVSKGSPSWAEKKEMCVPCMNYKEECKCPSQKP